MGKKSSSSQSNAQTTTTNIETRYDTKSAAYNEGPVAQGSGINIRYLSDEALSTATDFALSSQVITAETFAEALGWLSDNFQTQVDVASSATDKVADAFAEARKDDSERGLEMAALLMGTVIITAGIVAFKKVSK